MKNNIIIAIDQGSSSSRAVAIGQQGEVLVKKSIPVNFIVDGARCEYNAKDLLDTQLSALEKVLEVLPQGSAISALAVSCQRSTVVLWDKKTGLPLCPALSWLDGRSAQEAAQNPLSQEEIHAKTGLYKTPYYSAPKIRWCIDNYPSVREALKEGRLLAAPVASFIIWHLTDGKVYAADYTTAQRMLLLNIKTLEWDEDILKSFNLPVEILPKVLPTNADYGSYKGIPITVCVGDQQGAAAATGLLNKGDSALNYGTGAFMLVNAGQDYTDVPGILTSLSWNSALNKKPDYILEGPVNSAGSLFSWLNQLGITFAMQDIDKLCQEAKNPVWMLPALGGLGAPYWDFKLTPVIAGLNPATTRQDIIAGALNSLCYLMADIAFYIQKAGFEINRVQASGGLSVNDGLLKFQSDILQKEILRNQEPETTALGAAFIAAHAAGVDTRGWHVFKNYEVFKPASKQDAGALYAQWRAFFEWAVKKP